MAENVKVPPFTEAPSTVVGSTPQTEFGFNFPFWESDDILVYVDDVLLDATDYTVEGLALQDGVAVVGGYGSGTVTLDTAVSNVTVTIDRLVVGDRETQFSTSSPLGMRSLNADLNRLTARQQDLSRHKATRPVSRAGLFHAYDSEGNDIASPGPLAGVATSELGESIVGAEDEATVRELIKVGDTGVDVKTRYGLTALNDTADQAKIETALDELPVAGKVYFPQGLGAYKLTETLNITRAMDIENELNATFRLDVPATDTTSPVISININEMPDQIDVPGASVRGMVLSGGRVFSFDTTASTANTSGSYGLAVNNDPAGLLYSGNLDGTYYTQIGLRIVNMSLGGRLGGLLFAGTGNAGEDSVFFSGPEFCTIENGFTMEHVPDGQRALFCQSLGTNPAFTLNAIGGAYNHTFQGGTAANRDGLAHVVNGDRFLFDNIQVEHGIQYLTPSQNHKASYVYIEGQDRVSIGGRIKGSNFGTTTYNDNIIVLGDTDNVLVDENYFGTTEDYDIFFDSAGTTNFIWGTSNVFRGVRSRQTVGAYKVTDPSRLLKVGFETGVGPYNLKGLYNLWINGADVFPSGGGFGLNGLEFMVTRTGQVYFQGQLTGSVDVDLPADTTLLTAPDWLRPVNTQKIVVTINDTPHVLTVLTTGDIYSETGFTAPAGTALSLYMNSAFYHAIINVPYEDGVE